MKLRLVILNIFWLTDKYYEHVSHISPVSSKITIFLDRAPFNTSVLGSKQDVMVPSKLRTMPFVRAGPWNHNFL